MSLKEWAFGGVKRSCDIEPVNALFYKNSHVYQNLIFVLFVLRSYSLFEERGCQIHFYPGCNSRITYHGCELKKRYLDFDHVLYFRIIVLITIFKMGQY